MRLIPGVASLCLAASLMAIEPRKSPADYPAQGKGNDIEVGAEYTVRSFLADGHSLTIEDYLMVEVGVYPAAETMVSTERFTLRINGKDTLVAQTPGIVAASLKYPDWNQKPRVIASAGPVIFGRPQAQQRFPGDPRQTPQPRQPVPAENQTNPIDYPDLLTRTALPEGRTRKPVDGYIFFAYDGKLKAIKSVELLVDGVPMKLR